MLASLKKQDGFTIAEMAIVIAIGGIILAIMGSKLVNFIEKQKVDSTNYKLETIRDAMGKHLQEVGRYPCPSSLTVSPGQPAYNREVTVNCSDNSAPFAGTLMIPGARAVENPPLVFNNFFIRVGGVPVRSLNLPDEFAIDAWGNRFSYAVSSNLATPTQFFPGGGILRITGFNDGVNPPVSLVNPADSGHYILMSHGSDGAGARSFEGVGFRLPCLALGTDQDSYNCNFPGSGAGVANTALTTNFIKTFVDDTAPNTVNYFNDFVTYREEVKLVRFEFPSNAVMAFNRTTCPEGWTIFPEGQGRYIMGATGAAGINREQLDIGPVTNPNFNRVHNVVGANGHNPELIAPHHVTLLYCQKN